MTFRRWKDGTAIGYTETGSDFEETYGAPYQVIHRADFHQALCSLAKDLGVNIITASRVVSYDGRIPSVATDEGKSYSADLVVAADGVRSLGRPVVLGGVDLPPLPTGFAVYRAVVDTNLMKADPDTAWLLKEPNINIWFVVLSLLRYLYLLILTGLERIDTS